ncbi:hypothetical protein MKEN_01257600 [Mycena kentingensis (nom. inval.)]|nr:hypothetical protein MKEN_01257600 [Mycena kentingensis (nom. inval.)]
MAGSPSESATRGRISAIEGECEGEGAARRTYGQLVERSTGRTLAPVPATSQSVHSVQGAHQQRATAAHAHVQVPTLSPNAQVNARPLPLPPTASTSGPQRSDGQPTPTRKRAFVSNNQARPQNTGPTVTTGNQPPTSGFALYLNELRKFKSGGGGGGGGLPKGSGVAWSRLPSEVRSAYNDRAKGLQGVAAHAARADEERAGAVTRDGCDTSMANAGPGAERAANVADSDVEMMPVVPSSSRDYSLEQTTHTPTSTVVLQQQAGSAFPTVVNPKPLPRRLKLREASKPGADSSSMPFTTGDSQQAAYTTGSIPYYPTPPPTAHGTQIPHLGTQPAFIQWNPSIADSFNYYQGPTQSWQTHPGESGAPSGVVLEQWSHIKKPQHSVPTVQLAPRAITANDSIRPWPSTAPAAPASVPAPLPVPAMPAMVPRADYTDQQAIPPAPPAAPSVLFHSNTRPVRGTCELSCDSSICHIPSPASACDRLIHHTPIPGGVTPASPSASGVALTRPIQPALLQSLPTLNPISPIPPTQHVPLTDNQIQAAYIFASSPASARGSRESAR